ncbi:Cuticlin-3 [Trichinella pseudospiralis]
MDAAAAITTSRYLCRGLMLGGLFCLPQWQSYLLNLPSAVIVICICSSSHRFAAWSTISPTMLPCNITYDISYSNDRIIAGVVSGAEQYPIILTLQFIMLGSEILSVVREMANWKLSVILCNSLAVLVFVDGGVLKRIRRDEPAALYRQDEVEIPDEAIIQLPYAVFPEPNCAYSVHAGGPSGPLINSISIGDLVYHKWSCATSSQSQKLYCISVHNCTVGNNRRMYPIIDSNGCTLEPSVVPSVTYPNDLEGGILSHAFSLGFSDPTLAFQCKIKLLIKENGVCPRKKC